MLSRVADCIFWIARSMERAESLARLLQANQQLLLDAGAGQEDEAGFWMPILRTTGDEEAFAELGISPTAADVAFFLSECRDNPNSITNAILTARENARMIRDQISDEIWQCLNLLHHSIRSDEMSGMLRSDPAGYYERVMLGSYLFQGIARSTMSRTEGWLFLQMGTNLERADKTSRLVDTGSGLALVLPPHTGANPLRWASLLHSCSAYHAFHELSNHLDPPRVLEFLFLSNDFPRSVRYAVNEVDNALRSISPHHPGFARSDPLRVAGRLKADLDFTTFGEILDTGLNEYIDRLPVVDSFNEVRLRPASDDPERVVSFLLTIQPPVRLHHFRDESRNYVHWFEIPEPHSELRIESNILFRTTSQYKVGEPFGCTFDELAAHPRDSLRPFLSPSRYISLSPEVWRLALDIRGEETDVYACARAIMDYIYMGWEYSPNTTNASTHADESFTHRSGVCQDFAHVMIALCRSLRIPARYVSGYLYNGPNAHLRGAQASHAWCEIHLPGRGWFGLDPTNNLYADECHAKIATEKPSYVECENWILAQKGGSLDAAAVEKLNTAITGYIHNDATRAAILGTAGRPDDGTIRDAVNLNNLDDWASFHAQELK